MVDSFLVVVGMGGGVGNSVVFGAGAWVPELEQCAVMMASFMGEPYLSKF